MEKKTEKVKLNDVFMQLVTEHLCCTYTIIHTYRYRGKKNQNIYIIIRIHYTYIDDVLHTKSFH